MSGMESHSTGRGWMAVVLVAGMLAACGGGDGGGGDGAPRGAGEGDGGTGGDGASHGTGGDPSAHPGRRFVGTWASNTTHAWTYTCDDGNSGGFDRTQPGFYWTIELGTGNHLTITSHDPAYPNCMMQGDHRSGSCPGDWVVNGDTVTPATASADYSATYVLSADGSQLRYAGAYLAPVNGEICRWTDSDTLVRGDMTPPPPSSGLRGCTRSTQLDELCEGDPSRTARGYTCTGAMPPRECEPAGPPGGFCCDDT
jgi:hypothetical protein